jgi:hypothetical protein
MYNPRVNINIIRTRKQTLSIIVKISTAAMSKETLLQFVKYASTSLASTEGIYEQGPKGWGGIENGSQSLRFLKICRKGSKLHIHIDENVFKS